MHKSSSWIFLSGSVGVIYTCSSQSGFNRYGEVNVTVVSRLKYHVRINTVFFLTKNNRVILHRYTLMVNNTFYTHTVSRPNEYLNVSEDKTLSYMISYKSYKRFISSMDIHMMQGSYMVFLRYECKYLR